MNYIERITRILEKNGGMITNQDCLKEEIPTVYLTRLMNKGILIRIQPGLYIKDNEGYDVFYSLQYRYKKIIFSHETALFLLGVNEELNQKMHVSVYSGYKFNQKPKELNVHYVKKDLYELGVVETKTMFGNRIKVYSYERVICDFIKNRKDILSETFIKAITEYKNYNERNLSLLFSIAEKMNISEEVRKVMEIAYE